VFATLTRLLSQAGWTLHRMSPTRHNRAVAPRFGDPTLDSTPTRTGGRHRTPELRQSVLLLALENPPW